MGPRQWSLRKCHRWRWNLPAFSRGIKWLCQEPGVKWEQFVVDLENVAVEFIIVKNIHFRTPAHILGSGTLDTRFYFMALASDLPWLHLLWKLLASQLQDVVTKGVQKNWTTVCMTYHRRRSIISRNLWIRLISHPMTWIKIRLVDRWTQTRKQAKIILNLKLKSCSAIRFWDFSHMFVESLVKYTNEYRVIFESTKFLRCELFEQKKFQFAYLIFHLKRSPSRQPRLQAIS